MNKRKRYEDKRNHHTRGHGRNENQHKRRHYDDRPRHYGGNAHKHRETEPIHREDKQASRKWIDGLQHRWTQFTQKIAHFMSDICDTRSARIQETQARLDALNAQLADQQALYEQIHREALDSAARESSTLIENAKVEATQISAKAAEDLDHELAEKKQMVTQLDLRLAEQQLENKRTESFSVSVQKKVDTAQRKLARLTDTIKRMQQAEDLWDSVEGGSYEFSTLLASIDSDIAPTVEIKLHCMDVKDLRKKFNQNKKLIAEVLEKYKSRYTTKTNAALYQLMTIALEAELQNILHTINFGKLDDAHAAVKAMCDRYIKIAMEGNQNIAPTLIKFIGEINVLYANAVNIEYEYYIKKEQIKEEQRAIREKMREEAADRRRLAEEQKKIEQEQQKYSNQIDTLHAQIVQASGDDQKTAALQKRIDELQGMLAAVETKKEEIISRQNGQAGHVYVISNLGSFGDDIFKIGMTRRMDPMERIDELGSASVPFPFDVHSVIFSENAVQLEHDLHAALNDARLNKVNLRKEFFKISLDELEAIVYQYDPSAEFNRTMLAEQYKQSLSIDSPVEYTAGLDALDDEEEAV